MCKKCNQGFLVKSDKLFEKYICTNLECKEVYNKCPICDGYLERKQGYSPYLRCRNFPDCDFTRKL